MYHKILIRIHKRLIAILSADLAKLGSKRVVKLRAAITKGNKDVIASTRKEQQISRRMHVEHRIAQEQLRNKHMLERRNLRAAVTDLHAELLEAERI